LKQRILNKESQCFDKSLLRKLATMIIIK
jgi:hypothetical protein